MDITTRSGQITLFAMIVAGMLLFSAVMVFLLYLATRPKRNSGRYMSFFEWCTGKQKVKTREGTETVPDDEFKRGNAPKFLVWFVAILSLYLVTGVIVCGKQIASRYPSRCGNTECLDQMTALTLWPIVVAQPERLPEAQRYFRKIFR